MGQKLLAQESSKIVKAREKLLKQKQFEITPLAIKESREKISKWISDNSKYRVAIKEKIELFNSNQNAAPLSRKTQQFAEDLKAMLSGSAPAL
jgi:hypothetical protein